MSLKTNRSLLLGCLPCVSFHGCCVSTVSLCVSEGVGGDYIVPCVDHNETMIRVSCHNCVQFLRLQQDVWVKDEGILPLIDKENIKDDCPKYWTPLTFEIK